MIYHPEMGEKPAMRLFATRHNFRNSYSICWPGSRDKEARNFLRALRIRPLKCSPIQPANLGEWSHMRIFGEDGFRCLISGEAHDKMINVDACAHEMLLD